MRSAWVSRLIFLIVPLCCCAFSPAAPGAIVNWGGFGESGLDPYGQPWLFQNSDTDLFGVVSWGIPGRGIGTASYHGTESIDAISVEFFGLPAGVSLVTRGFPNPWMSVDPFAQADDWIVDFPSSTAIRFSAPSVGRNLDRDDNFLLFATFTGDIDFSQVSFQATYSRAVPEPSIPATLCTLCSLMFFHWRTRART
jgi:hypothetical protein